MRKFIREFRIIPTLIIAAVCLVVLKVAGLLLDGGYIFRDDPTPRPASWAEHVLNFPTGRNNTLDTSDVTGSVDNAPDSKPAAAPAATTTTKPDDVAAISDPSAVVSPSERAVLERLQARRKELDTRAREIDIRENLVKSAEQKLEGRLSELKATEARITAVDQQKTDAEAAQLKGLVTMYENMRPKDAARVFDRLDIAVLYQIASQIAPRKLSDIVGQMQPENAERLTVEMARRAGSDKSASISDLPKIEGRPQPVSGN
jgi:flagellar motility protein MotE (MotC chaperone)